MLDMTAPPVCSLEAFNNKLDGQLELKVGEG